MEKRTIESENPVMVTEGVLAAVVTTILVPQMNQKFTIEEGIKNLAAKKIGIGIFLGEFFQTNYFNIEENKFSGSTVCARVARCNACLEQAANEICDEQKEISLFEFFIVLASELHRRGGILGAHNVFFLRNIKGDLVKVIVVRKKNSIYIQENLPPKNVNANISRIFYRNTTLYQSN